MNRLWCSWVGELWSRLSWSRFRWQPLIRLVPYMWQYRFGYFSLASLAVLSAGFALFTAWFFQHLAQFAVSRDSSRILSMLPLALGVMTVYIAVGFVERYLQDIIVNQIELNVQRDLYKHTLRMRLGRLQDHHSGQVISRLTYDVSRVGAAVGIHLLNMVRLLLVACGASVYLLMINWRLTLISIALIPPAVVIMQIFSIYLRRNSKAISEAFAQVQVALNESLSGVEVIRTYTLEAEFERQFDKQTKELLRKQLTNSRLRGVAGAIGTMAHLLGYLLTLSLGAFYVAHGVMNIGDLFAFMALIQHLIGPMMSMPREVGGYQAAMVAVERIWELMKEEEECDEGTSTVGIEAGPYHISCRDLIFQYSDSARVLNRVNIEIPEGRTVALVGPSGAGKSTLFHLLLGLYPPTDGNIVIGKRRIEEWPKSVLRNMVSYVPQETFLFTGTVLENIRIGRPDASEWEVIQAAREASAHEFIVELPDGYRTQVGEKGAQLSGGQKQRIAIARALLKNAPIVLLDEVTSALDARSEKSIQDAFIRLLRGRTVVMIAHRLSTIRFADYVYVLDRGAVVERGTYDELMHSDSFFANLHRLQFDERRANHSYLKV